MIIDTKQIISNQLIKSDEGISITIEGENKYFKVIL
jgi:hypothetical protein